MFGWLKRRRKASQPVGLARPVTSTRSTLPGDSLDSLSPLHPLSPLYGGHAAPDTSVSHSYGGTSYCSSDSSSSPASDGGPSGGGCD